MINVEERDAIKAVMRGDHEMLIYAFVWSKTPQGIDYWRDRQTGLVPLSEADKEYLQSLLDGASENDASQAQGDPPETGGEQAMDREALRKELQECWEGIFDAADNDSQMKPGTALAIGIQLGVLTSIMDKIRKAAD